MTGLRFVEGVDVDGRRARRIASADDCEVHVASALINGEIVGGELYKIGGLCGRRVELAEEAVLLLA